MVHVHVYIYYFRGGMMKMKAGGGKKANLTDNLVGNLGENGPCKPSGKQWGWR